MATATPIHRVPAQPFARHGADADDVICDDHVNTVACAAIQLRSYGPMALMAVGSTAIKDALAAWIQLSHPADRC
jgi:hypothetical protein